MQKPSWLLVSICANIAACLLLLLAGCANEDGPLYEDLRSKPSDELRARVYCGPHGGTKYFWAYYNNKLSVVCNNGAEIKNIAREEVQRGKPVDHPTAK